MDIKEEIKVIVARRGTTLKRVCELLSERKGKYFSYNNLANKIRRGTIRFSEVQDILELLDYKLSYSDKIGKS